MVDEALNSGLRRRLLGVLAAAQRAIPWSARKQQHEEYDAAIDAVARRIPVLSEEVRRNKERVRLKLGSIVDAPLARREVLLRNSPPSTLVALAHELMRESFDKRFGDVPRSRQLAELSVEAARASNKDGYLSDASAADLLGEALLYLGNARRLVSDLAGADAAFVEAESVLAAGTRDRVLRADLLDFIGSLRVSQRRSDAAAAAFEQEIRLRRLSPEPDKLGAALINQGVVATHRGDLPLACDSFREGLALVEDQRLFLVAMVPLATAMARAGKGNEALKIIERAEVISVLIDNDEQQPWLDWTKGLAYLALVRARRADYFLERAQVQLADGGRSLSAACAGLDRASALVALGKHDELLLTMSASYKVFAAEGLSERALAAFMILHRAVQKGTASVRLATEVANFIDRSRYDRNIRFERKS